MEEVAFENSMVLTDGTGRVGQFQMRKQHVQRPRGTLVTPAVQLSKNCSQNLSGQGHPLESATEWPCWKAQMCSGNAEPD